jgi:hypothetical protein
MICFLFFAVLAPGPQATPVTLGNSTVRAGGFVSQDLSFWFVDGSYRVELGSGKHFSDGWLAAGLISGDPPVPFARTENQAHYDRGAGFDDPGLATSFKLREWLQTCDALSKDLLLTYTDKWVGSEKARHVILTEFHLDSRRDGKQNSCWLLVLSAPGSRTVGARYIDEGSFEVWVLQPGAKTWSLVRYVGKRANPKSGLRRDKAVELTGWPASKTEIRDGFVPNSFVPLAKTFLVYDMSRKFSLVNAQGSTLKSTELSPDPSLDRSTAENVALWRLTVPDKAVPGGKAAWEPIARSTNGRHWLVRSADGGKHVLLPIRD